MKKLLIMLSAVALATGAFADEEEQTATLASGTETFDSFDLTGGPVAISTNTVSGGQKLWYSAGDAEEGETGAVTAYGEDAKHADIAEDSNVNYLNVSTTTGTPLYRKLVAHDNEELLNEDSDPVDIGTGIFVDTYVQFSGSETAPTIPDGSKLVVWVQAIDFDDNNTPEDTSDDIQGSTNLVVTAAQLNDAGVPTATNFVIETAAGFNFEGWHRLTIRSIKEITSAGSKIAGFTVFVDGVQLAAKETQIAGAEAVLDGDGETVLTPAVDPVTYNNLMGAYAYAANLTAEAKALYNNRRLFVSLVRKGADWAQTLSAVGFDGTGKIDNLTVSDDRSDFVFARGDFYFTLTWDNGIADFTVTADVKDAEGNDVPFTLEMKDLTSGTPFAIPNTATKITISGIEAKVGSSLVGDDSRELDLLEYSSLSLTTETTLVKIGEKGYSSFAVALSEATAGATLELVKPVTLNEILIEKEVVINLAGQNIEYEVSSEDNPDTEYEESANPYLFNVTSEGSLKIYDSVGGGCVKYAAGHTSELLIYAEGLFTLGEVAESETDNGATIEGYFDGTFSLVCGKILCIEGMNCDRNEETGVYEPYISITDNLYVDEGDNHSTLTVNGDYFVITPPTASEPEPTTFAVTVLNENTNATYTSDPADLTGLEADTEVTITATAAAGYTYDGATLGEGWTIDANDATKATYTVTVNDNLTVTVPTAVAVPAETFNVTVTAIANATFTSNPADLTGLEAGTSVTITATPNKGYTYAGVPADGWTVAEGGATATYTATVTADLAVTVLEPTLIVPVAGGEAPQYATEADATAAAAKMDVSAEDAALGINKSYFTPTVTGSDAAGWTVTTELNAEVVQPSTETAVKALPEAIAAAAEGASITVNVSGVKAGLQYVVEVVTELGDLGNAENLEGKTWTRAGTDGSLALPVTKPTGGKGFFKVHVKHR